MIGFLEPQESKLCIRMVESGNGNPNNESSEKSEALILYAHRIGDQTCPEPVPTEQKPGRVRAWFAELLMSLIKTAVAFFLGYLLVQSVELDLKRAQFSADAADKLKAYVIELNSGDSVNDTEKSKATALALGGFGSVAAYPLVQLIEHGNELQVAWGKLGLEQAGLIANEPTCDVIVRVIDDPTSTFRWQTRKAAIETAGSVACSDAAKPLERLSADVTSVGVPAGEQTTNFERAIEVALTQIERTDQRARPWWRIW